LSNIEFECAACKTVLRVDESHAGKRARCPKCGMIHDVPRPTTGTPQSGAPLTSPTGSGPTFGDSGGSPLDSPSTQLPHGSSSPSELPTYALGGTWELRGADGQTYGPVDKTELDQWAQEGQVSPACYVREQGGEWFPASQLYPHIAAAKTVPHPHLIGDQPPGQPVSHNPFSSPPQDSRQLAGSGPSNLRPHNGTTILIFGILGLACCAVFGVVAVIMGANDLSAIKRGEMDPSGKGLTMAGFVMGLVSCGAALLGIGLAIVGEITF